MRTAYRCRAYPDEAQQQVLMRTFGCVRVVWNRTLAERHRLYHAEGKSLSYAASDAALTAMKKDPDLAFLSEISSVPLQRALRHQHPDGRWYVTFTTDTADPDLLPARRTSWRQVLPFLPAELM